MKVKLLMMMMMMMQLLAATHHHNIGALFWRPNVCFKHQCYLDREQTVEHLVLMSVLYADSDPRS